MGIILLIIFLGKNMKRLFTFLLVLFHISAFPQSFWSKVIDDQDLSRFTCSSLFQNSLILVGGHIGTASCLGYGLFAYDLKGRRVWGKDGFFDAIYTDSNSIYTVGYNIGIDDVGGDQQIVISKFDKNGKELFQSSYPELPHHYWSEPNNLDINGNGSIVASSKNSIIRADLVGKVISEKRMNFKQDISGIHFIGTDSFLISTNSALYLSDSSLNRSDSISFTENIVSSLIQNDTIFCLFPNKLVILDANLNILDTLITSTDIEFKKIRLFDGDLWIQGTQDNQAKILQLHNLSVSDTLTFDLLIKSPDFLVSPGNVVFTGTSNSNQIAICSYNKNADPDLVTLPDIEIVDFYINNIGFGYIHISGGTDFPISYNFLTEMVIKNNGNDAITSFAIYSNFHDGMNCSNNYFYQKFSNVLILPHQEKTINLNRMHEDLRYNTICFECLAPNSKIESNIENNSLCKTFVITGLNDFPKSQQYQFYPNPVKDFLNLKFEENGIKHIRLTNVNGSLLLETKITGCETNLDLSEFDSGIYLLTITSDSGIFTRKIVKE